MPRSLADGHTKLTFLTTEPANPQAPTAAELNAGINAEEKVLTADFGWGATDSDKVAEKALADVNNANALGASNYTAGVSLWRYFDETGAADAEEDVLFAAVSEKGTEFWIYARETGKMAGEVWATGDEIYLGGKVLTDTLQPPSDRGGFIKRRLPLEIQSAWENIVVAAGA